MICRHFGTCGGCAYQTLDETAYRAHKRAALAEALARHGLSVEIAGLTVVPEGTRRRASFKALKTDAGVRLGFHAAKSHAIVDMEECRVLTPTLVELAAGLRAMLTDILAAGEAAEIKVTETEAGTDIALRWAHKTDPALLSALGGWAGRLNIARISRRGETLVELARPFVTIGKARVALPCEAFLQPTSEGERALQNFVTAGLRKAKHVVDLFSGCGTFSLPLAERAKVHAVELADDHLAALAAAARQPGLKPVTVEKRNLFKRPMTTGELADFDGACLDPPRAGALEQVRQLAATRLKAIVYVSCDAETFARDGAVLIGAGWKVAQLQAVDQFLWSDRIELAAVFVR